MTLAVFLVVFHQGPVVVCLLAAGQLGRDTRGQLQAQQDLPSSTLKSHADV